ncbi:MAG TPA: MASE3 domain-containing protein [Halanaerobiales bacterium]|nr:MASE3 domain-containing protein [Halanaerobiales bacterium]
MTKLNKALFGDEFNKSYIILAGIILLLIILSFKNFLLFHSLIELSSIIISFIIFIIAIYTHEKSKNYFLVFLGITLGFVGLLDLLHTLVYEGMGVFPNLGANLPTQLWIIARYIESGGFVLALWSIKYNKSYNIKKLIYIFLSLLFIIFLSLYFNIFPKAFVEGSGLTGFKIISEYIISLILVYSLYLLNQNKDYFEKDVYKIVFFSIIMTIFSEISFTFYVNVYGISNITGHVFKLLSVILVFKAIIDTGFKRPYDLLYRQLKLQKEEIEKLSFTDQLTGLYNRRFFEEEMKRLDTERQLPLSFIMADLNGLKIINDSYGHEKGDEILIQAAKILKESLREEDILARQGGDEFAVLLPNTTKKDTEKIEKRIKEKCKKTQNNMIPISIALGIATKEKLNQDIEDVFKKADDKMYKNKLAESRSSKSNIVEGLINVLNSKSNETKEHSVRMTKLGFKFGQKLKLSNSDQNRLSILTTLHDIGKININEKILKKKGSLKDKEWESIKKHSEYGYKIAKSSEEFAAVAKDILAHHEKWDGNGYPKGSEGEDIPYLARIISIIDAYDVMTNNRPYSKAISKEEALTEIKNCAGSQFDPELAKEFIELKTTN